MQINRDTVEEFWCEGDIAAAYRMSDNSSVDRFLEAFAAFLGVSTNGINFTSSGKSALTALLMARSDDRPVVMVPALNCVRVKDAVEAAGCEVQTYDFQIEPGFFDWDLVSEAITPRVGVLIVTHLYGVPVDLRRIREVCRKKGVAVIEDCAQTLGAYVAGVQVGTWGDAAIFSFSYDKPISLGWGGMALINAPGLFPFADNYFRASSLPDTLGERERLSEFVRSMRVRRARIRAGAKSLSGFTHRVLNRLIPNKSCAQDRVVGLGPIQAELGMYCLDQFAEVRSIRNSNAKLFSSLCPRSTWPVMSEEIEPAWLKQKVSIPNSEKLDLISRELRKQGIRAGNFNWPSLITSDRSESAPISGQVASCWMDVPIHQRMEAGELEQIVSIIQEHLL